MASVSKILSDLGGTDAVSEGMGLPYQTVHAWITRGFPAARCIEIRDYAKANGLNLTVEQIMGATTKTQNDPPRKGPRKQVAHSTRRGGALRTAST